MKITLQSIIGDIIADNYRSSEIFKKYDIDFCRYGQLSIEEACTKENIAITIAKTIVQAGNAFFKENHVEEVDYRKWPLDDLVDHIVTKLHAYIEAKIPLLKEYLDKIESVHGKEHPELIEINRIFKEASGQLAMHLKKEELILFPFIQKMAKADREHIKLVKPHFGTIKNPIHKMDEEHDFEGKAFRKIAALSNNYSVPENGCNTYKVTFGMLKEFEDDLYLHIHKENNILFQRAIALEEALLEQNQ